MPGSAHCPRTGLVPGFVKELQEPNHAGGSVIMDGIFHLMTIVVKNQFGGNEKKFESCDPDRIVYWGQVCR